MKIRTSFALIAFSLFVLFACKKKENNNNGSGSGATATSALPQGNYSVMEFRMLPNGDSDITQKNMLGPFKPAGLNQYTFTMDSLGLTYNYKFDLATNIGIIEIVDSVQLEFDIVQKTTSTNQFVASMIGNNNPFETTVICNYIP